MNHHSHKMIEAIFAHPLNANIDFKEVEHLLAHLGATVQEKGGNKVEVTLQGKTLYIHRPHGHTLPKDEVAQIRDFLESCGVTPSQVA